MTIKLKQELIGTSTTINYYGIISDGDDNLTQNNTEEAAAVDGK